MVLNLQEKEYPFFSIANTSARIGGVFNDMKRGDSGFVYNSKSLYYFEKIGMKRGIGVAL